MDELLSENLIQQPHSFLFSTGSSCPAAAAQRPAPPPRVRQLARQPCTAAPPDARGSLCIAWATGPGRVLPAAAHRAVGAGGSSRVPRAATGLPVHAPQGRWTGSARPPSAACRWGRASRPTPDAPCEGPRLARWAACARRRLLMARASAVPCCEPRPHAPPRALPPAPRALKPRAAPSGRPCRGAQWAYSWSHTGKCSFNLRVRVHHEIWGFS